ncbi:hypothetical protein [Pseudarthrobacter sp. NKDBFgelt]|uniref:hypothetical protein n=1 Tax=Pseudarthrobacter sp. NKDBFgelt TaxID=3384443 RepID=UPI0038D4F1EC
MRRTPASKAPPSTTKRGRAPSHRVLHAGNPRAVPAMFGLLLAALLLVTGAPAYAVPSPGEGQQSFLGNDISWPQCNGDFPSEQAFAIVGVNNGLANTTNPCLSEQLRWAEDSAGHPGQPTVSLYVNTANPGAAGS